MECLKHFLTLHRASKTLLSLYGVPDTLSRLQYRQNGVGCGSWHHLRVSGGDPRRAPGGARGELGRRQEVPQGTEDRAMECERFAKAWFPVENTF